MKNQINHNEHQEKFHDGFCICPKCGEKILYQNGLACSEEKCPFCSAKMMREYSLLLSYLCFIHVLNDIL